MSILGIGLAIIPFIRYLINSELDRTELIIYYILYLTNSVASYFVVYRTMILKADQKEYIVNNCNTIFTIIMYILQLTHLIFLKNFLGYLIIQVICTIGNNLVQNQIALKKYPYLREKCICSVEIVNKQEIFGNVKATFLFKISDTLLDQTDSIIISVMFGTAVVGYYANYYMVITYLVQIASIIVSGLIASFGNLYVTEDKEKMYKMIKCSMLFFSVLGTFCCACYASIIQEFISMWVGKQYVMHYELVIAVLMVFYLRMATNTIWMCRSTMGVFKEVQYINLIGAILNIVLSIVFGHIIGISGVIIATAISRLVTSFWYEGRVVFKKLNKRVETYYLIQLKYLLIAIVSIIISVLINTRFFTEGLSGMFAKVCICMMVTIIMEFLFNRKTVEFQYTLKKLFRI